MMRCWGVCATQRLGHRGSVGGVARRGFLASVQDQLLSYLGHMPRTGEVRAAQWNRPQLVIIAVGSHAAAGKTCSCEVEYTSGGLFMVLRSPRPRTA